MRHLVMIVLLAYAAHAPAQHEHHPMGTTKTSSEVRLEVQDDTAAQVSTIHLGPINLPANSDHTTVHQAPGRWHSTNG